MVEFIYRVGNSDLKEFHLFSLEHIIAILLSLLIIIHFFMFSPKLKEKKYEPYIRYSLATFMILTSVYIILYKIDMNYPWYRYIPEGTCAYGSLLGAYTLITKNKTTFILNFFYGWGAFTTIFFPNIAEGFTRWYFYQFYLRHILIVVSALYMMKVFDFKVYKKDFRLYLYITLPLSFIALGIGKIINKPNEFNMLYMLQPAVNNTPLDLVYNVNYVLYVIVWLIIGISFGYIYGIPFYSDNKS